MIPTDDEVALVYFNCNELASVPVNEAENGVSDSVSEILILTIVVPVVALSVSKFADWFVNVCSWCLVCTLIVIDVLPTLSYWSLQVIVGVIVSPLEVSEPLISTFNDRFCI